MNRTYFITGASSGFGHALGAAVLARGDRAILAARRTESVTELSRNYPDTSLPVRLDVTDRHSRNEALEAALEHFGRVDVLANIAGRGSLGAAEEFTEEQLREQMELNFFAATELTRSLLPTMRAQSSGHILNLTSIGGIVSIGGFGAYCASKFALEGWSEALRDEVSPLGIRVTIVEPGAFRTEFAGDKNMRPERRIEAYRSVIAPIENYLYGSAGEQPGDPHKAALAMIAVVESAKPPLRLLLGADAYGLWEEKSAQQQSEFLQWRDVGIDTAYANATVASIGS